MIFSIFLIIVVIALLLFRKYVPLSKGEIGEHRVANILSELPEGEYKIINNLLIKHKGGTSQIDHVVISEYRIFVIETKFYNGWVYGNENSEYWTQNIYGNKYRLYNPILQNKGHVNTLRQLLPYIEKELFIPIVAFSPRTNLNIDTNEPVIYWDQLTNVIRSYKRKWISTEQAHEAYEKLIASNIYSKENQEQHVKNVRMHIAERNQIVASGKCPRCGGKLVLREGRYGSFYGCSNFPHCKYTCETTTTWQNTTIH